MRVWFLKTHDSVCPGCSTGCNVHVDERDGEVQRLRPRRNVDVNKSWMCDFGRASYKDIALATRVTGARVKGASSWRGHARALRPSTPWPRSVREAGEAAAFMATPQATNEDLFAFAKLAEAVKGRLDFRVGDPDKKRAGARPTTCCCATIATPTPRAASTRASAGRASPRS